MVSAARGWKSGTNSSEWSSSILKIGLLRTFPDAFITNSATLVNFHKTKKVNISKLWKNITNFIGKSTNFTSRMSMVSSLGLGSPWRSPWTPHCFFARHWRGVTWPRREWPRSARRKCGWGPQRTQGLADVDGKSHGNGWELMGYPHGNGFPSYLRTERFCHWNQTLMAMK